MAKNDLFRKDWLDVVFENRNKSYGAYQLRLTSSRTMSWSLLGGILFFSSVCVIPAIASTLWKDDAAVIKDKGVVYVPKTIDKELTIDDVVLPELKEETRILSDKTETHTTAALASVRDVVKHIEYEIVSAENATDEVPTIDDFLNADIGSETIAGNSAGTIVLGRVGTEVGEEVVTKNKEELGENSLVMVVEERAEPYETFAAFNQNFASRFRAPDLGTSANTIKVVLSFVVEKDGSLTDIKVLRDPGHGAGKEAIRVLKSMPKWKAAKYNNKAVRSQFTLPITIQVK